MSTHRRAVLYTENSKFMEEAGHELGFFRSLEEIKALSSIPFFKNRKEDNQDNENEDAPDKD